MSQPVRAHAAYPTSEVVQLQAWAERHFPTVDVTLDYFDFHQHVAKVEEPRLLLMR